MVTVKGTHGNNVQVEIIGVSEAITRIRKMNKDLKSKLDAEIFRAANYIQQEVQESIIGNRAETKSVDTGRFANSIKVDKIKDNEYKIFTRVPYAKHLEYGTSKLAPRSHFRNTKARTAKNVKALVDSAVKSELK
jgi:hypothetical protein